MRPICALALLAFLAQCAPTGEPGYAAPAWTREYCMGLEWRGLGRDDASRYPDVERRLAALEETCGIHMRIPKDEYLSGYRSVRG